jgi:Zn-dependent peptidase ImmA (M78 family)
MGLQAGYLELAADELAEFLLKETGQIEKGLTNPVDILTYLKLTPVMLDLEAALPGQRARPRGVLSFGDRVVGVHSGLIPQRARFTVLHEVAHYILPEHQNELYVCTEADMSLLARNELERQASHFAADLLFQGNRFTFEANSVAVSAASVKLLSQKYGASFEATARRLVAKNFRPCMLVVFEPQAAASILDPTRSAMWVVRYAIASPAFANQHFGDIRGDVPQDVVQLVTQPGRDLAESVTKELEIAGSPGQRHRVIAEFFCNTYNIFCLLTPQP